jgi:hypothetical protein
LHGHVGQKEAIAGRRVAVDGDRAAEIDGAAGGDDPERCGRETEYDCEGAGDE